MANEARIVPVSSGIISDLLSIDSSYAETIIYDDVQRTTGRWFVWKSAGTVNNGTVYASSNGGY